MRSSRLLSRRFAITIFSPCRYSNNNNNMYNDETTTTTVFIMGPSDSHALRLLLHLKYRHYSRPGVFTKTSRPSTAAVKSHMINHHYVHRPYPAGSRCPFATLSRAAPPCPCRTASSNDRGSAILRACVRAWGDPSVAVSIA